MGSTVDLVGLRSAAGEARRQGRIARTLWDLWRWVSRLLRRRRAHVPPSGTAVPVTRGAVRAPVSRGTRRAGAATGADPDAPVLQSVPAVAMRLQIRAASAFLERLGGRWIPGVLHARLRTQDVLRALDAFCVEFGLRLPDLLDPDAPDHEPQRDRLHRVLGLLVSLERVERELAIPLPDVYDTLRHRPERAEPLIDRLEDVAAVWRFVETTHIHWPEYRRLRAEVRRAVASWRTLDDPELARFRRAVKRYQLAEARLSALERELARERDRKDRDRLRVADQLALERLDARARRLLEDLETGRAGIEPVLVALEELLVTLQKVVDRAQEMPVSSPRPTLESALAVLGLTTGATLQMARGAYRSLAIRAHPDKHPGDDPESYGERMARINVAWDFVKVQLS